MPAQPIRFYDRYTKTVETEKVFGEQWLRLAYENPLGRLFVWAVARRKVFSWWYGRKMNKRVRDDVFTFLDKKNIGFVPSESNCFMMDARRPAGQLVKLMAQEKVFIGRVWPAWPNHTRITVGTAAEMEKFKTALTKVWA